MQSALQARSKLPDVGTTIFTVIGQLAAEHNALNLSQGAPNFAPDPKLIDGVARAMREGHNQYAPMAGIDTLREALAQKMEMLQPSFLRDRSYECVDCDRCFEIFHRVAVLADAWLESY